MPTVRTAIKVSSSPLETGEVENWEVLVRGALVEGRPLGFSVQAELVSITVPERYASDNTTLIPSHVVNLPSDGSEPYVPTARFFVPGEPRWYLTLVAARQEARDLAAVLSKKLYLDLLEQHYAKGSRP